MQPRKELRDRAIKAVGRRVLEKCRCNLPEFNPENLFNTRWRHVEQILADRGNSPEIRQYLTGYLAEAGISKEDATSMVLERAYEDQGPLTQRATQPAYA